MTSRSTPGSLPMRPSRSPGRALVGGSLLSHIKAKTLEYLDRVGRLAVPLNPSPMAACSPWFSPQKCLRQQDFATKLQVWRKDTCPNKMQELITRLSMVLLKARARGFDVRRRGRREDASENLGANSEYHEVLEGATELGVLFTAICDR